MASVISATTGAVYGAVPTSSQHEEFIGSARVLLEDAQEQFQAGDADLALESAYRSALRTAGASISQSAVVAKRKRLPSSAWEKLSLTGARGAHWADTFSGFSRLRGRVASGIELRPSKREVERLIDFAEQFFLEVSGGQDTLSAA